MEFKYWKYSDYTLDLLKNEKVRGGKDMRGKKFISIISIIAMLFSGTNAVYASYTLITKDTENIVTVSDVGILLINEDEDLNGNPLYPGEKIKKRIAVKNTGKASVYVRVKLDKYWSKLVGGVYEKQESYDSTYIQYDYEDTSIIPNVSKIYNDTNWTYNSEDGYYYYYRKLEVGQTTEDLINYYSIDSGLDVDVYSALTGNIAAYGEAVQNISDTYLNDYIVFNAGSSKVIAWKDITINPQSIVKTPSVTASSSTMPSHSNVEFANDAQDFVTLYGDNLFLNMSNVLPGDTISQNITIENKSDETVNIYMYAKAADNNYDSEEAKQAMNELLQNLELQVGNYNVSSVEIPSDIYHNKLGQMSNDKGEDNPILLGTFKKGDVVELMASITLDPSWILGNAETKIEWVFVCKKLNGTGGIIVPATSNPPIETNEPIQTEIPIVTVFPSASTNLTTINPITKIPNTEIPTPSKIPTVTEVPINTPDLVTKEPLPIETEFINTPTPPNPSRGPIGEAGLNDSTPNPIGVLPTSTPVEKEDNTVDAAGDASPGTWSPNATNSSVDRETENYTNPKTSDGNRLIFWVISFLISFIVFCYTVKGQKYNKS